MGDDGERLIFRDGDASSSSAPILGSLASSPSLSAPEKDIPADALGKFDQYIVLRQLGGGAFGIVYLALDTVSKTKVAVKTLHPLLRDNADEMARMRANFAIVSRLHHPHIAPALVLHLVQNVENFAGGLSNPLRISVGDPVLLMSYAPGETLSSWKRQFPSGIVPVQIALDICRQVADVLDYAHANKVVHRDIKPSNIVIENRDGDYYTTVLDFGLAAEIRSSMGRVSSMTGDVAGTRPYMAPEQWAGGKQDGKADQYALACLLYELLSGNVPFASAFESGDSLVMERAVVARAPEPINGLSKNLNDAIIKALSKDPTLRHSSCRAFIDAASERASPSRQFSFRNLRPFVAGAALALLAGLCVNIFYNFALRAESVPEPQKEPPNRFERIRRIKEMTEDAMDLATVAQTKVMLARLRDNPALTELVKKAFRTMQHAKTLHARMNWDDARQQYHEAEGLFNAALSMANLDDKALPDIAKEGNRKFVFISPGVRLSMRWIPAADADYVRDSHGFWLGETEVTQEQWESLGMKNDSELKRDVYPVERISHQESLQFIAKLNSSQNTFKFRLPTTNEWAIAAKGERYPSLGWLPFNSGDVIHPVGHFPNRFGVSDLFGNVYEWCLDRPNGKNAVPIGGCAINTNVVWRDFVPQKDRRIGLRLAGDLIQ